MTKSSEQTALRLPSDLRQRLASAAEANHRTVSEEMRVRLQASFTDEPAAGPQFRDVLNAIGRAAYYATFFGQFEDQPHAAYGLFEIAVSVLLEAAKPDGYKPLPITNEWVAAVVVHGAPGPPGSQSGLPVEKIAAVLKRRQGETDAR